MLSSAYTGDKFAEATNTYVMLQRLGSHSLKEISIFISDTFAERCYVLIFDITWMMDISLNDTSLFGLFIYERHFLPGHV